MNKWVLIAGGLTMVVAEVFFGLQMSAGTVTGHSLVVVGAAMVGE